MAHQINTYPFNSVVERAIDIVGTPRELMDKIGAEIGEIISRQRFQGWRQRAAFSIDALIAVHKTTKIPYTDLIIALQNSSAKNKVINEIEEARK